MTPGDDLGGDPACWAHLFDHPMTTLDDALLADVVRQAADAIIICDREGTITLWNRAAETLFGWPQEAMVGSSLNVIIPARHRQRHWDAFHAAIERGTTVYADEVLHVPAEHHDGRRRSIAFTVTLLRDAAGSITAIAAIIRNETDARKERLALEARLKELAG